MAARISDALRVPPGPVDLRRIDPGATPRFKGGKAAARKAQEKLAPRLADLQERLFAEGRKGGTRSVLLVLQGLDTSGKGGTVRHVVGQMDPAGGAHHLVRPADSRGAPPRLPVADPAAPPRARHRRGLRPLPLRGRRNGSCAEARSARHVVAPVRRDQSLRGTGPRRRHAHREVLPAHLDPTSSAAASARAWRTRPSTGSTTPAISTTWASGRTTSMPTATRSSAAATTAHRWYVVPADRKWYRNWAITSLLIEQLEDDGPRAGLRRHSTSRSEREARLCEPTCRAVGLSRPPPGSAPRCRTRTPPRPRRPPAPVGKSP